MKRALLFLVVAAALITLPAAAQTGTWTAVASSGDIDEASMGIFQVNGPNLAHLGASLTNVVARYNVTNTFGGAATDVPPWTALELTYVENSPSGVVSATLFQTNACTGATMAICTVSSVDNPTATCRRCTFPAGTINFGANLYFVEVVVNRTVSTVNPTAVALRIY